MYLANDETPPPLPAAGHRNTWEVLMSWRWSYGVRKPKRGPYGRKRSRKLLSLSLSLSLLYPTRDDVILSLRSYGKTKRYNKADAKMPETQKRRKRKKKKSLMHHPSREKKFVITCKHPLHRPSSYSKTNGMIVRPLPTREEQRRAERSKAEPYFWFFGIFSYALGLGFRLWRRCFLGALPPSSP